MIVCSCNQLTERQVLEALTGDAAKRPRSAGQVHRCLGCKPDCGRCMRQIRQLFSDITSSNCQIGCAVCPGETGSAASAVAAMAAGLPPGLPAQTMQPAATTDTRALHPGAPLAAKPVATTGRRQLVIPAAQRFVPSSTGQRAATPPRMASTRQAAGAAALQLRPETTPVALAAAAE